ncbi:MAG: alpha-mannosidase [Candidatus Helarchaeota archaeon]
MLDEILENNFKNRTIKWLDARNFFYPGSRILLKIIRLIFNLKNVEIFAIGQSHLDACWRWVRKDTIRRNYKTFSRALEHMEMFPCFKFSCSSPQYFEWMEKYFPKEFESIKQRVEEGRLELLGGMWIEPDMNLINGESMVRQRLYGQRYYLSRFGKICEVAWLSDTFGYNWQLPQVLAKSGAKYFYTNKMSWNSENIFPFGVFFWKAPEGSKVLTYSFPYSVNLFVQEPNLGGFKSQCRFLSKTNEDFNYNFDFEKIEKMKTKKYIKELGLVYGIGDGGGGPLLEEIVILKDLLRHKEIKFVTILEYFKILEKYEEQLPTWDDELFLEFHRGVYTTQAWIKEANRKAEIKLKNLEILAVIASFFGAQYPKIEDIWKLLLFNQFHDILPGSSIPEVYEEARRDFKKINGKADEIIDNRIKILTEKISTANFKNPYIVFNSLNWNRSGIVKIPLDSEDLVVLRVDNQEINSQVIIENGKKHVIFNASIPSVGYRVFNLSKSEFSSPNKSDLEILDKDNNLILENKFLKVKIDKQRGFISSIYHKILKKEVVSGKFNWIQLYKDDSPKDSAWNIDKNYYKKQIFLPDPHRIEISDQGSILVSAKIYRNYKNSKFVQTIRLYSQIDLVDFTLDLDFNEKKKMIKIAFPFNLKTEKFNSEIPFGVISRPTRPKLKSQMGRWEVSAQKWIDLTGEEFGVTLINSSKYGFNVIGNILKMTILRTMQYPRAGSPLQLWDSNKITDLGKHSVNYALKIHESGNAKYAVNEAHEFNEELFSIKTSSHDGELPQSFSFLEIEPKNIILSAFKLHEDAKNGNSKFILRIYESIGEPTNCKIVLPEFFKISEVFETDLLEFNPKNIDNFDSNIIRVQMERFEVKTLLISLTLNQSSLFKSF